MQNDVLAKTNKQQRILMASKGENTEALIAKKMNLKLLPTSSTMNTHKITMKNGNRTNTVTFDTR